MLQRLLDAILSWLAPAWMVDTDGLTESESTQHAPILSSGSKLL